MSLYVFLNLNMEFLDSNFTKDSSILFHATHSPFYRRILKKPILYSSLVLKSLQKTRVDAQKPLQKMSSRIPSQESAWWRILTDFFKIGSLLARAKVLAREF
jgi:hypothetical protein